MKKRLPLMAVAALLMTACGQQKPAQPTAETAYAIHENLPGDSTRYGLACDGCTDSILVLLPYEGGDPDTFDIIRAVQERRLYGRPHIGDELAVTVSPDSTAEVVSVVNMSMLQGLWSYMASPTLRPHMAQPERPFPDSIRERIMVPREYSIRLKHDGTAYATGEPRQQTSDNRSPVDYPKLKRYAQWHLFNGRLVLLTDSSSQQAPDTADIRLLRRDSLVLRFADHEQGYYRNTSAKR